MVPSNLRHGVITFLSRNWALQRHTLRRLATIEGGVEVRPAYGETVDPRLSGTLRVDVVPGPDPGTSRVDARCMFKLDYKSKYSDESGATSRVSWSTRFDNTEPWTSFVIESNDGDYWRWLQSSGALERRLFSLVAGARLRAELQGYDVLLVELDLTLVGERSAWLVYDGIPEGVEASRVSCESYVDQWGNPVRFKLVKPDDVILRSFGPDGIPDTADDIVIRS